MSGRSHSGRGYRSTSTSDSRHVMRDHVPRSGAAPSRTLARAVAQATCRPHSVLPLPAQRPARASSPLPAARVQGVQPIDGKPRSCSSLYGMPLLVDVAPAVALAPVDERLHLDDAAACVEHELRGAGALRRLVAADAGQPAVGVADRPLERRDLAQPAAAVGLALPQRARRASPPAPRRSAAGAASRPRARSDRRGAARVACVSANSRPVSISTRRVCGRDLARHVHEDRGAELPGAREHHAAAEALGRELDELLRAQRLEVLGEPRDVLGGQVAGEVGGRHTPTLAIRLAYLNKKARSCKTEPLERVVRHGHRARVAEPGPVGAAVPVGSAGRHEAELRAQPQREGALRVVVVGADSTRRRAGRDRRGRATKRSSSASPMRSEYGCASTGRAAARGDELDGLLRAERAGVDVGRLTVGEQAVEGLLRRRRRGPRRRAPPRCAAGRRGPARAARRPPTRARSRAR